MRDNDDGVDCHDHGHSPQVSPLESKGRSTKCRISIDGDEKTTRKEDFKLQKLNSHSSFRYSRNYLIGVPAEKDNVHNEDTMRLNYD